MNNRGQNLWISVITALMIFMAGMLFLNYLKLDITTFRGVSGLDCSNLSISDGAKVTCLGADLVVPALIMTFIAIGGGIIGSRFLK